MSMACAIRTVAVLSCGSSEHAERLLSKADTTIWQVCWSAWTSCTAMTRPCRRFGIKPLWPRVKEKWAQPGCVNVCFKGGHLDVHIFMHCSKKTHFFSIHTVTITVFISFWSCLSSPARKWFENRFEICTYHGGFLKRCLFVSSMINSNTLLLHWFHKIRQNLLWKETNVTLGKAAAIVFEAWVERYPSRPYAGRRTVFLGPWFWKDFQNTRNFLNTKVSFTCTVERCLKSPTSICSQLMFLSKRNIGWLDLNKLFSKKRGRKFSRIFKLN